MVTMKVDDKTHFDDEGTFVVTMPLSSTFVVTMPLSSTFVVTMPFVVYLCRHHAFVIYLRRHHAFCRLPLMCGGKFCCKSSEVPGYVT
jgi:hypothetical protein